jgi:dolichyl-phosphate beta-glucosyltransferase
MHERTPPRLSVIIPAYNEELRLPATLRAVLQYLAAQSYTSEVVVVDDGSTDRTARVAQEYTGGAVALSCIGTSDGRNQGKGAAVRRGMLLARGEFRLFTDADNSTSIDQLERFWPEFESGCDVAIGSRNVRGSVVSVHQNLLKELAGRLGNKLIQTLAVPGIHDTQAGFKMFTRRSVEVIFPKLTIQRWGHDVEILVIARRHGLRIKELPIVWNNAPGSKVAAGAYIEVLREVWQIRRNLSSGLYG